VLLAELEDFVTRHRPCGQLTGDAPCGVVFMRLVTLEEALRDLGDDGP
jgi:hypothetical protein